MVSTVSSDPTGKRPNKCLIIIFSSLGCEEQIRFLSYSLSQDFKSRPLKGPSVRPSDPNVSETVVQRRASLVAFMTLYGQTTRDVIVHRTNAKIINENCWCRLVPVGVLTSNVRKTIAS